MMIDTAVTLFCYTSKPKQKTKTIQSKKAVTTSMLRIVDRSTVHICQRHVMRFGSITCRYFRLRCNKTK